MARNSGMDVATGDYVYFMDSDDTIDRTLLEQVIVSLKDNPAQIVVFGMVEEYFSITGELKKIYPLCYPAKVFRNREELRKEVIYLEKATMYGYSWNKIYDFQYIKEKNLRFKAVTLIEDIMFNVECFMQAETLNILGTTPYHYKKRNTASLTARFVTDYFDLHKQRLQMIKDQYVAWGLYTNKVRKILGNIYCRYIFSALQRNCDPRSDMRHKDRKQWVQNLFASKLYADIIPAADPESYMVRVLAGMLKRKQVTVCLISARVIYFIKTAFPLVFAKLKQNR